MNGLLIVITVISVAAAVTMGIVVLRLVAEERRRSEARVAALAAEVREAPSASRSTFGDGLFEARETSDSRSRFALAAVVGAAVVGTAAAIVMFGSARHATAAKEHEQAARPAAAAEARQPVGPLELVALSHDRAGSRLTVRGVVRNAVGGAAVSELSAVVLVFAEDGRFLTSGRASLTDATLAAGAETTFVISIPDAADVGRYRVSFKQGERTISHIDTRT
jgi:hypothetical protein